jgi:hypothetical protein
MSAIREPESWENDLFVQWVNGLERRFGQKVAVPGKRRTTPCLPMDRYVSATLCKQAASNRQEKWRNK